MDINSIKNDGFINRKRTDSVERNRSAEKPSESGATTNSKAPSDQLDLSSVAKNDLEVGRSALRNMDMTMLDRVREIRANIKKGAYSTDQVYKNITNALIGEFQTNEAADFTSTSDQTSVYSATDLQTLQQRLADSNDSIVSEIAGRLLGEL